MRVHLAGSIVALALFGAAPAQAASCVYITYYGNASMNRVVGWWSNCPGHKGLHGRATRFREREVVQLGREGPGPGRLPCEFLAKGCPHLPDPRD